MTGVQTCALPIFAVSIAWGSFWVFLYFTYLLAFFGKSFNAQIFTFEIFFAYMRNLNDFIGNISVSPVIVYIGLFLIPAVLMASALYMRNLIFNGMNNLRHFIFFNNAGMRKQHFRFRVMVSFLLLALLTGSICYTYIPMRHALFQLDEPIVCVFYQEPIQGQYLSNNQVDFKARRDYPKGLRFIKKNVIIIIEIGRAHV